MFHRIRLWLRNVRRAQTHKENVRESSGLAPIDGLVGDIRYVARSLRRHLILSASIVATLSLTIGISTGVFTLVDAAALRPRVDHDRGSFFRVHVAYGTDADPRPQFGPLSLADFLAYRAAAASARAMTAYVRLSVSLDASDLQNTRILAVTCDFFSTYVPPRPLHGRALQQADCDHVAPVITLTESIWRERYAADSTIVGRTVRLNDRPLTVVGVLPMYDGQLESAQAWIPYTMTPGIGLDLDLAHHPDIVALTVDGFANHGRSRANVAAEVAVAATQQDRLYPHRRSRVLVTDGSSIEQPGSRARITAVVTTVMLVLAFVVLIACTNVTMLLLARAEARRQEVAVRLAMGASRARLLRLLLTETVFLAAVSGAASIWFAYSIPPVLIRMTAGRPLEWSVDPDWRVFAWLTLVTLLAGVAAGLVPALQALDVSLVDTLKTGGSAAGTGRRRARVYSRLIASQLALSFVLLAGAYLLRRAYQRMEAVNVGHATWDLIRLAMFDRDPLKPHVGSALRPIVRPRVLAVPGVQRVAFASVLPSTPSPATSVGITFGGRRQTATSIDVSSDFFETLGTPILRGRALGDAEPTCASGGCAVVVSQELSRRLFGKRDPIGAAVRSDSGAVLQIVGVAADVSTATGMDGPLPIIYEPWDPERGRYTAFVRIVGRPAEIAGAIGATVRQGVPDVSLSVQVVQAAIDEEVRVVQQIATLVGVLAAIAVALAMIGVHGVVSFSVRRRAKELGVRIALGATPRDIYRAVATGYARPIFTGMAAGLVISVPAALFVQGTVGGGRLPILDHASPLSFVVAALTMIAVTAFAIAGPARRAGGADPLTALRTD